MSVFHVETITRSLCSVGPLLCNIIFNIRVVFPWGNHRLVIRFSIGLLIHPSSFRVSSFSCSDLKEWWIWNTIRRLTDFIEWMEPVLSSSTKPRRRSKVISWGYSHGCIHTLKSCLTELAMGLDGPSPCAKQKEISLAIHLILFNCIIAVEWRISLGNIPGEWAGNAFHLQSHYFSRCIGHELKRLLTSTWLKYYI